MLESLAPHSATVVVMMGLGRIDGIAELLIARGWNVMTPAAVIFGASTSCGRTCATLRDLRRAVSRPTTLQQPGTVAIGDVVS